MRGFYDKILVNFANSFGKKFNAKVSDTKIRTEEYREPKKIFSEESMRIIEGIRDKKKKLLRRNSYIDDRIMDMKNDSLKESKEYEQLTNDLDLSIRERTNK